MEAHRENIDCYDKTFECLDEEGELKVVKDIPKVISGRKASTMQRKKFYGKDCRVYAAHVLEATNNYTPSLGGFHVLQEFMNVFPYRILGLPPNRDINFTFELVPGAAPVSQTPCRVSTLEMLELKMQFQE